MRVGRWGLWRRMGFGNWFRLDDKNGRIDNGVFV